MNDPTRRPLRHPTPGPIEIVRQVATHRPRSEDELPALKKRALRQAETEPAPPCGATERYSPPTEPPEPD